MRQIKFRAKNLKGEYVYGDLLHWRGNVFISDSKDDWIIEPDSVAQFVGYDAEDREIYEGDSVVGFMDADEPKIEYIAELQSVAVNGQRKVLTLDKDNPYLRLFNPVCEV